MCKIFNKAFLLGLVTLCACSQSQDAPQPPEAPQTQSVSISMTRGVQDDFIAAGVENYTIYIYRNTKADKSLFSEQQVSATQSTVTINFSLGDSFKIFAVANAASVTGKENFETMELHLNPQSDSQVWMTEVSTFTSDKSVTSLEMSMQRLVARVEFAPAESEQELSSQNLFDTLNLSFSNTADTYKVSDGSVIVKNQDLTLTAATGYKGGFYTFSTASADSDSMLDITFLKGGEVVNKSAGALETGVKYAANNRYNMSVPVLANDYVEIPWTRAGSPASNKFTIDVTSL